MEDLLHSLLNYRDYTPAELYLFLVGCYLWVYIYAVYIRNIIKTGFIEIPIIAACGDIAWEVLWSTVFKPDMGLLFVWGYRAWLILDIYIFYAIVKDGKKQLPDELKSWWNPWTAALLTVGWGAIFAAFKIAGMDTSVGTRSAFPLNLLISYLYIPLFLRERGKHRMNLQVGGSQHPLSYSVAWVKMLSTTCNVSFLFLHYPNDSFLLTVGPMIWLLDCTYIVLHVRYRSEVKAKWRTLQELEPATQSIAEPAASLAMT